MSRPPFSMSCRERPAKALISPSAWATPSSLSRAPVGPGAFQLTDRVGVVRPAHCTALGKIILASLQPDQLERFLKRVGMKPSTEKSITEVPVLLREIDEIRRTGIAFDDGEFNLEVRCVAVPVTDFTGNIVGAIGISGPIWRLSKQALHNSAKIVQAAAHRLSREFGASGHREFFLRTRPRRRF